MMNNNDYRVLSYKERWDVKHIMMIQKRREKVEELKEITVLLIALMVFLLVLQLIPTQPQGHYRYKNGNLDGSGIFYEWVIDEE